MTPSHLGESFWNMNRMKLAASAIPNRPAKVNAREMATQIRTTGRAVASIDTGSPGTTHYIGGIDQHCNPWGWSTSYVGDLVFRGSLAGAGNLAFCGTPIAVSTPVEMSFLLNADNSAFTGNVSLARGDLFLNHTNALTAANSVLLNPGMNSNATLRIWNKCVTIGALSNCGAGNSVVAGSGPLAALTVCQNTDSRFGGILTQQNGMNAGDYKTGSVLGFTKAGTGTLTLGNTNAYSGTTTINAGTLKLAATGSLASTNIVMAAGGVFDVAAQTSYAMTAANTYTFGVSPANAGSAGRINASGLDIGAANVFFAATNTLDSCTYLIASYTRLTGTAFARVGGCPDGYVIDYNYKDTRQIALVRHTGTIVRLQ